MKNIAIISLIGLLGACATPPEKISAAYVSPLQYKDYDCDQIAMETDRVSRRVQSLNASLKKTASDDSAQMAVGMILFFPALFFLEGSDGAEAQEYARLKGESDALQSASVQKKCMINSVQKPEETETNKSGG